MRNQFYTWAHNSGFNTGCLLFWNVGRLTYAVSGALIVTNDIGSRLLSSNAHHIGCPRNEICFTALKAVLYLSNFQTNVGGGFVGFRLVDGCCAL